jgi:acetyl-CoA acetyltransferase
VNDLSGKYAIVGIGDTPYVRGSGMSTRAMAVRAVRAALDDAGLSPKDVDGFLSFNWFDSNSSPTIAGDLGIHLKFHMDAFGGGSSLEALIGLAMGAIEVGMCRTVVIWRSMNGYSGVRPGGSGEYAAAPVEADELWSRPAGVHSAGESFAPHYTRYMYEYGVTPDKAAQIKSVQSFAASNNPKALMKKRVSVDDVLGSRLICEPLHLLDCCLETDNAGAIVVTTAERAMDLRQAPVRILGVAGRVSSAPGTADNPRSLTQFAGHHAKDIVFPMAGVSQDDIDVTSSYDCFTWTSLMQLEAYGFCGPGEAGDYAVPETIGLGGTRPNNTSGGQLCEGYANGVNLVIENIRQLRGEADDSCGGEHTYDYSEGGCRQVRDVELTLNMGFNDPNLASALILTNR